MLGGKGGLQAIFILQNFLLTLWEGSGALKTCRVREETEIDSSSILSQGSRTSCYKTGSEFSPLGRSARLLEERQILLKSNVVQETGVPGKILRKRRSHGLSRAPYLALSSLPQEALPQFPSLKGYR